MHNVRNRMANRGRKNAPICLPDLSGVDPMSKLPAPPPPTSLTPNAAPFMLQGAGPKFPEDVLIPRSRGATIVPAIYPAAAAQPEEAAAPATAKATPQRKTGADGTAKAKTTKPAKTRTATKPRTTKKTAKSSGRSKTARPRKPAIAKPAVPTEAQPAAAPSAAMLPAAVISIEPTPPAAAPIRPVDEPAGAIPLSQRTTPLPRNQALLVPTTGVVGKIISWLTRLAPRKKRSALPKARASLRSARPAPERGQSGRPEGAVRIPVPADEALARRMMLELSEENARLRRELEALRLSAVR